MTIHFHEVFFTPDDIADTQDNIRKRVLKLFARRHWIEKDEVKKMLEYDNSGFSLEAKVKIESWDREGLERLIRYCARPCFAGENLRWNGPWLNYRLPKPTHTGKTFIQLDPLEFIDRIAAFIPSPRRHRHHYHGIFAPNAPLRSVIATAAIQTPKMLVPPELQQTANQVTKASLNWAKLIARIYEVNPLLCVCGKELKIIAIVTNQIKIRQILMGIGWPAEAPAFDPPSDFSDLEICQLMPTLDGFPIEETSRFKSHRDPPKYEERIDSPHLEDNIDPPHWVDTNCVIYN
jgi:Putative transposase